MHVYKVQAYVSFCILLKCHICVLCEVKVHVCDVSMFLTVGNVESWRRWTLICQHSSIISVSAYGIILCVDCEVIIIVISIYTQALALPH